MATTQQVTAIYNELLGRNPDPTGMATYSKFGDLNAIRNSILGSTEYKQRSSAPKPTAAPANPSQPLFDFAAQQTAANQAMLDRQKSEQEGLFNQYTTQLEGQEKLPVLYNRLTSEAGIPQLTQAADVFKTQIYSVKDLLDRLNEDVTTRTSGTFTNEAQRNRQIAAEGDPLRTSLARLGTGLEPIAEMLNSARGEVGNMLNLTVQQQGKEMQPIQMRIEALGDRFAREITGFNNDKENMLTALMDKLQRERELSDRDWQLAQQLAAEEREFQRQKQLAKASASNNLTVPVPTTPTKTKSVADWLALGGGGSTVLQPANSGISLQGSGGPLQGSGSNLQGGAIRLQ